MIWPGLGFCARAGAPAFESGGRGRRSTAGAWTDACSTRAAARGVLDESARCTDGWRAAIT